MAELMEGRRELQALTAGVLEATDDGVICGVGKGPKRTKAGVGGASSGLGSKNRGSAVAGVGVLSFDSMRIELSAFLVGVGVVGDDHPQFSGGGAVSLGLLSGRGKLSNSGVKSGMMLFQAGLMGIAPAPGEGGGDGVHRRTISCHLSNVGLGMWSLQSILLRNVRSLVLISHTLRPDILLQALAE